METAKPQTKNSKVYLEIVRQLRKMITADGLKTGDKIPSERELTERLNVGRSSVREALRALELLGLIETRRGEGTYIRDFRGNQLVQLLSTFILQDEKAKKDVTETKYYIEMNCLRILLQKGIRSTEQLYENVQNNNIDDDEFFYQLVLLADNHLFMRIWMILMDYYNAQGFENQGGSSSDYLSLLEAIDAANEDNVIRAYKKLRNLSNSC
ncbi:FadR family transcriptional regulator [Neobacillus notoginsengisoli]|uniref:FadR family transcriptional regulator n=1 Tax=Neobacillus notoginsengisoli TaxID=1578198 RepID=A0A417YU70_9BACI|nr:GntR family transcriptional regulator [Neobacillus notoginsengisoli]RHW40731.1 FadR family transcriptional regulator [Neobacillus notoginsengisoli]